MRPRIICGYVKGGLRPETKASVRKYAPSARFLNFTGNDEKYWNAIRRRWTGKKDLIVIEQDMVITESTISSLKNCNQLWCSYGYIAADGKRRNDGLGCTLFSAQLQRLMPMSAFPKGWIPWFRLDVIIRSVLKGAGFYPHDHGGIEHLHEY